MPRHSFSSTAFKESSSRTSLFLTGTWTFYICKIKTTFLFKVIKWLIKSFILLPMNLFNWGLQPNPNYLQELVVLSGSSLKKKWLNWFNKTLLFEWSHWAVKPGPVSAKFSFNKKNQHNKIRHSDKANPNAVLDSVGLTSRLLFLETMVVEVGKHSEVDARSNLMTFYKDYLEMCWKLLKPQSLLQSLSPIKTYGAYLKLLRLI